MRRIRRDVTMCERRILLAKAVRAIIPFDARLLGRTRERSVDEMVDDEKIL